MSTTSSIAIVAVLGLAVLGLGVAVVVAGTRRRERRSILTGAVGIALGLAVLIPAGIVAAGQVAS
ncbi:hypothetical protein [Agrococcus sp. SGAir0287]|uniref:hypothetical protein n=1 Tax=Agrococcus sp. SGAir0287 TaxID=2070347 RepID=UPI0010CCFC8B|nr:hypothetical protein [Agrococcus sp. SGAir0287]QCR18392.1 hypothetical protein C1N71_02105 [Agrococcus sp. SGAir0287]